MANSSISLIRPSTAPRSTARVSGSSRLSAAVSGTCFTRTTIFMLGSLRTVLTAQLFSCHRTGCRRQNYRSVMCPGSHGPTEQVGPPGQLADHPVHMPQAVAQRDLVVLLAESVHVAVRFAQQPGRVHQPAGAVPGVFVRVLATL